MEYARFTSVHSRMFNTVTDLSKARLAVDQLSDVKWYKDAFEKLVVDQGAKEYLRTLVSAHFNTRKMNDMMNQRRKGLRLHFYGDTGLGKEFTAGEYHE